MKVMHTSDLHGELMNVVHNKHHILQKFDVWIETGDFFPNDPITGIENGFLSYLISPDHEKSFQRNWLKERKILEHITRWLNGRPFVSVQGNHDFISLVDELKEFGYEHAYEIGPEGFELLDFKWAGFPNINYIQGTWNHETLPGTFYKLVDRLVESRPDILVTHSPPWGILDASIDGRERWGIGQLTNMFNYMSHQVKAHFFGHVHEQGGKEKIHDVFNIPFFNGSQCAKLHELDI